MLTVLDNPNIEKILIQAKHDISVIAGRPVDVILIEAPSAATPTIIQKRDMVIRNTICFVCDVTWSQVTSSNRKREYVIARQLYCLFATKLLKSTLNTIGQSIGHRDHTTVIHSLRTINDLIATNNLEVMSKLEKCTQLINEALNEN